MRSAGVVQFYGMLDGLISLGNVARDICLYLAEHIQRLRACHYRVPRHADWTGFPATEYSPAARALGNYFDPRLQAIRGKESSAKVGIFCGIPDVGKAVLSSHDTKVIITVCETSAIPSNWVDACNEMDFVLVPSEFCRQAYMASGVTRPVEILHYAAESEYQVAVTRPLLEPFVFFNTFNALSSLQRKSLEELVRCFLKAFPAEPNVRLRLRTQRCRAVVEVLSQYERSPGYDRIELDPLVYSTSAEYAALYHQVHCTVHPSKGEGFGLIPFHSILSGTPVITNAKTGLAEYITPENAMVLQMGPEIHGDSWGNQPGMYFSVDEDELVETMRHSYSHYESELAKARMASDELRTQFDKQKTYKPLLRIVEECVCH